MKFSKIVPDNMKDLVYPEQLTLWSMRFWSDGFRQNYSAYETLREAYFRAKCPGGLLSLDNFFSLVIAGHSRPVDVRCPCCAGVSNDEWRILQALALAQAGEGIQIRQLISHFLEPATVRIAEPIILQWAQQLKDSGLILPLRSSIHQVIQKNYATKNGVALKVYTNPQKTTLH